MLITLTLLFQFVFCVSYWKFQIYWLWWFEVRRNALVFSHESLQNSVTLRSQEPKLLSLMG